jgi:hypothetical protein
MREINEVIACHDGNHVLALCTDGGVLYYHYDASNSLSLSSSSKSSGFGHLIEFQSLTREVQVGPEFMTDDSWAIKRVGRAGEVVVIRACKGLASKDEEGGGAIVDISLLSDLAPESCTALAETSALADTRSDFLQRNGGLCYHDNSQSKDIDSTPLPSPPVPETSAASSSSSSSVPGKPPSGRPRKNKEKDRSDRGDRGSERSRGEREKGKAHHKVSHSTSDVQVHNSTPREKKAKTSSSSTPTGRYSTPAETARGVAKHQATSSSSSGGGKRQGHTAGMVMNISPQERDSLQALASPEGGDGGESVSKRLYAPTPTAKRRPASRRHEEDSVGEGGGSVSADTSASASASISVVASKTKERKSGRKRPLMLQVKCSGEESKEGDNQVGTFTSPSSPSSSTSSSSGQFRNGLAFAPPPLPAAIPHPGPAPTIKRIKIAPYPAAPVGASDTLAAPTVAPTLQKPATAINPLLRQFLATKQSSWAPLTTSAFVAGIHLCDSTFLTMLGPNSRQTAETLLLEQDRLYQLFLIELLRGLETIITQQTQLPSPLVLVVADRDDAMKCAYITTIAHCKDFMTTLFQRYQHLVTDVMKSQMIQIVCAIRKDKLLTGSADCQQHQDHVSSGRVGLPPLPSSSALAPAPAQEGGGVSGEHTTHQRIGVKSTGGDMAKQWSFVHCSMYTIAAGIVESVEKMAVVV